jgi:hypothetical protein
MQLPIPAERWTKDHEVRRNQTLTQADGQNRKKGADVELSTDRLILHSPNGTRYQITVSNAGTISAVAI